MMVIAKKVEGNRIILELDGKLDTNTSPDLREKIGECRDDFRELVLDFAKLSYISSAGLRVLLETHQDMHGGGKLIITNPAPIIKDIFEITGFTDILTIE
jgi:anti-sigma B factor antagonist